MVIRLGYEFSPNMVGICRGKLSSHEHLWDRSPFYVAVRERREHGEQIEGRTRAVYPGSGRADA